MSYKLSPNLVPFIKKNKAGILTAPILVTVTGFVFNLEEGVNKNVTKKDFGVKLFKDGAIKGVATFSEDGTVIDVSWEPVLDVPTTTRKSGSNIVHREQQ